MRERERERESERDYGIAKKKIWIFSNHESQCYICLIATMAFFNIIKVVISLF